MQTSTASGEEMDIDGSDQAPGPITTAHSTKYQELGAAGHRSCTRCGSFRYSGLVTGHESDLNRARMSTAIETTFNVGFLFSRTELRESWACELWHFLDLNGSTAHDSAQLGAFMLNLLANAHACKEELGDGETVDSATVRRFFGIVAEEANTDAAHTRRWKLRPWPLYMQAETCKDIIRVFCEARLAYLREMVDENSATSGERAQEGLDKSMRDAIFKSVDQFISFVNRKELQEQDELVQCVNNFTM